MKGGKIKTRVLLFDEWVAHGDWYNCIWQLR